MLKFILVIFLLCIYSCSSISADWTSWQMDDVPSVERKWRICKEDLDGAELHMKGFCYQSEECRTKKVFIGKDKKECRRLTLICTWGDIDCIVKYGINNMTISNEK